MNFNPRKLFVIVGYPHAGKRKTAQQIFERTRFFPFKQPIQTGYFEREQFIVISSRYYVSEAYLTRIKTLIERHAASDTSFVITLNLSFGNTRWSIECLLDYFNRSGFEVHYLVLHCSMLSKQVVSESDLALFEQQVVNGTVYLFDRLVTQSLLRISERTAEVKDVMLKVLEKKNRSW